MKNIIGSFVFNDEGYGCLSGKWSHKDDNEAYPECAKLIAPDGTELYCGIYRTVWIESAGKAVNGTLNIELNPGDHTYKLSWSVETQITFSGQGMIHNGLLIGSYWEN